MKDARADLYQLESANAELAAMRDKVASLKKKLRPMPILISQCKSFAAELEAIKAVQVGVVPSVADPLKATQGGTSPAHPTARVEAVKDQARCEAQAKQTGFEAIESLLGDLKGEAQANDAEIASLWMELGAEKEARAAGEEELVLVRSALSLTQNLVEDVCSQLSAAETALAESASASCSCSSDAVRAAEAAAARSRSETPEWVSGSSSDDGREYSDSVTLVGTDGVSPPSGEKKKVWPVTTPPHLRRGPCGQSHK